MDRASHAAALALIGDAEAAVTILKSTAGGLDDAAAHSYALLLSHYSASDPEALFHDHRRWAERFATGLAGHPFDTSPDPEKKLRIGYVSADFKDGHPLTYFIKNVLAAYDREHFSVTCYSNVARADATTEHFAAMVDEWRDISNVADDEAARLIRADRIDLLVDLGGHCGGNRLLLFARKPAPVQITWLGYPDTTGLPAIDYRFTDGIADPPGASERFHTERLVRPAGGFLCYTPPASELAVSALPAWFNSRVTFASFQYPAKLTAGVIATWARVLQQVPRSELLLHHCFSDYFDANGAVRTRIVRAFAALGIEPGRLQFVGSVSFENHLKLYGHADIALDTFPYNGTTTTCESLWMGVPVITLEGATHAGRVGKSILTRAGLGGLVASTPESYVQAAVDLAADLEKLARLRASLRGLLERSPLMDNAGFTRGIESEYRNLWLRWCERWPETNRGL
jgi:predicted O-linked N-acetylglucosamine transferase (SPINDLY family)